MFGKMDDNGFIRRVSIVDGQYVTKALKCPVPQHICSMCGDWCAKFETSDSSPSGLRTFKVCTGASYTEIEIIDGGKS